MPTSEKRPQSSETSLAPSQLIDGRWFLERPIGSGAFGKVFLARNQISDQRVALKIFDPAVDSTGYLQELGLFFSEEHPNIVPTLSFGYTEGRKYLVYEYVPGGNLRDMLLRQPRVPPQIALAIAADVARGLEFAHDKGVVHRDLKPENILLSNADWPATVRICDFGLSVRCEEGDTLSAQFGSPAYMAPEQFGGEYDRRVDFYALGVIIYEMLFGRRPYGGDVASLRHSHAHRDLPLPEDGPEPLLDLLRELLAAHPDQRPDAAGDLRDRIARVRDEIATPDKSQPVSRPHVEEYQCTRRWRGRFEGELTDAATTRKGSILAAIGPNLVEIGVDGDVSRVTVEPHPIDAVGRGALDDRIAFASGGRGYVYGRSQGRRLEMSVPVPDGPYALELGPRGERLAVSSPEAMTVYQLDGEGHWEASIATYGTIPPTCFALDESMVWVAPESPRSRLMGLDITGELRCETTPGGSDLVLEATPGGLVMGARGRRGVYWISPDGFVRAEVVLQTPLAELAYLGSARLAAISSNHIELIDLQGPRSIALLKRPSPGKKLLGGEAGLFSVAPSNGAFVLAFHQLQLVADGSR